MSDGPHTWTLPLAPCRWAYLQLPSRNVTEDEWEQLLGLLAVFKPGLIEPPAEPDAFPVDEAIAAAGVSGAD